MDKLVEQLVLILENELAIYEKINQLAEEKKGTIIDGKVKELELLTEKEQTFTRSLIKLETLRSKTVDQLMQKYGLVEIENVTDLIEYMGAEGKAAVSNMKNQILGVVDELQSKNDKNKILIEQSLEFIDFNMELLTAVGDNANYGSDADDKDKEKRSIFDVRV